MRSTFIRRLDEIEERETDWISKLNVIDYIGLTDYDNGSWEEVHHDSTVTVMRNKVTGEVRGVYNDRRTDQEIIAEGGNLEFL